MRNCIRFCFSGALVLGLSSCSWEKKESKLDENSPVKVQIPVYTEGAYKLEIVELFSLSNVVDLKGSAAKFLLDANTSQGRLNGRGPHIRYMRDSNDVIVAQDDLSLQLLTAYAHMEKLRNLDEAVGAKGVLSYPRTIAVNARFRSSKGLLENNALYSGEYDALLVVPYSEGDLPLMANAGVIGHEHFHSLFQKMVVEPLKDKYPHPEQASLHALQANGTTIARKGETVRQSMNPRDAYHMVLLRGVNEGLADIWGWVYSGDNSFVGRSLPSEKADRELDATVDKFFSKEKILSAIEDNWSDDSLAGLSYQHGTQLARAIRGFSKIYAQDKALSSADVRARIGQALRKTLPALKERIDSLKDDEYLTLGQVAGLFTEQISDMHSEECKFVSKLIQDDDQKSIDIDDKCKKIEKQEKGTKP